jgi:anti-sigma-K factor RskA
MMAERSHQDLAELVWLYSLGALDDHDRRAVERHLRTCAECQTEMRKAEGLVNNLPYLSDGEAPPVGLRSKVERRMAALAQPAVRMVEPRAIWWPRLAVGFGVAALLLAFAGWWMALDLNREILALRIEIRDMESQIAEQTAQLALFRSPGSEVLLLAGQDQAPAAKGKMVWDPLTGGGLFLAANLPQLPADKIYQLWVIADGKPLSAGVFDVDARGSGELSVSQIPRRDSISAFAVTIEPAGGLPQPSGAMYLVGAVPQS